MTNYNFGPWIIHDRGECPVDPETLVQRVVVDDTFENAVRSDPLRAGNVAWKYIFAYRVAEPRKTGKAACHAYLAHSTGEIEFYRGHERENRWQRNLWLTYEIDGNGLPIPETIRAERAGDGE